MAMQLVMRLAMQICHCKNEMYISGYAFGYAYFFFFFCFLFTNFQNEGKNTAFSGVFAYQNNKAHRIRGALFSVKSYKIATYRVLGSCRAYISYSHTK